MIDIESIVIDGVSKLMKAKFKGVTVHSTHINAPSSFPCVMIYEASNRSLEDTMDEKGEHHVSVRYNVDVYTADASGKKQRAKQILAVIDDYLIGLGFQRASKTYTLGNGESARFIASCTYKCIAGESYSGDANTIMIYRR